MKHLLVKKYKKFSEIKITSTQKKCNVKGKTVKKKIKKNILYTVYFP